MARVIWSPQALDDIDSIAAFIARDSVRYAKIQVQKFFTNVEVLETFPKMGRVVPEAEDPNIRELIVSNSYRLIYQIVEPDLISVLTVHHTSKLFRKEGLSVGAYPVKFSIKEFFGLTGKPYFVVAGDILHGVVLAGMEIRHKGLSVPIKSVEMLDYRVDNYALVSLVLEFKDLDEKDLFQQTFLKGDSIEIFDKE